MPHAVSIHHMIVGIAPHSGYVRGGTQKGHKQQDQSGVEILHLGLHAWMSFVHPRLQPPLLTDRQQDQYQHSQLDGQPKQWDDQKCKRTEQYSNRVKREDRLFVAVVQTACVQCDGCHAEEKHANEIKELEELSVRGVVGKAGDAHDETGHWEDLQGTAVLGFLPHPEGKEDVHQIRPGVARCGDEGTEVVFTPFDIGSSPGGPRAVGVERWDV